MASTSSPLPTHPPHPQHTASRFPLPRLSLLAHTPNPPQTHHLHAHTHHVPPRRARGGKGSDSDSDSPSDSDSGSGDEESASQSLAPLPRGLSGRQDSQSKKSTSTSKSKLNSLKNHERREMGETRENRADSRATAKVNLDEDDEGEADGGFGFLSGIDLRAQMAAWERLKKGDTAKRASRGGGGGSGSGRGRTRGRGRGTGGHGRRQDEEGTSVGLGEGRGGGGAHGNGDGDGDGDGDADAGAHVRVTASPSTPTTTATAAASPPRRKSKSAKQRTAAARLVRQRNLAAKRRSVDDDDDEMDGGGGGVPGHEPSPPALEPKEGSPSKPLPRRVSIAMPTPLPIRQRGREEERQQQEVEVERPRMPLPRRAVVLRDVGLGDVGLGDVVLGDGGLALPRASSLSNAKKRPYAPARSDLHARRTLARGGRDGTSSGEGDGEEGEGEELGEEEMGEGEDVKVPQTLKIGPPRGVRRDERTKHPLPHPASSRTGVLSASNAQAGAQQEAGAQQGMQQEAGVRMVVRMGIVDKEEEEEEEGGEGGDRDPMEEASSTPVVPHFHSQRATAAPAASSQGLEEEGSGVPVLSGELNADAGVGDRLHHYHTTDDGGGDGQVRSSSLQTEQPPTTSTEDMRDAEDCAMERGGEGGVDVLCVGEGMDIDREGEEGEGHEGFEEFGDEFGEFEEFGDEFDIDLDALDLAYPDDETPSPVLSPPLPAVLPVPPLHPASTTTTTTTATATNTTVDADSAGRGNEILNTSAGAGLACNADILMAFEHAGEELENGDVGDVDDDEGEEDLLMDLAYPDGSSPSPSADTMTLPHAPSCPLPPPSPASTPGSGSASTSPAKRKRKGNGWIKRKRPTGPRQSVQGARAPPPPPVSAAENMSYEEWCRAVMARVATARRRCRNGQGGSSQGGAGGWDAWDSPSGRDGGGEALESTGDLERKDGAGYGPGGNGGGVEDGMEAEGGGAAGVEGPRAGEHQTSAGAFKIRIKIPSGLSLKSLLPPQPKADGPPIPAPPTPVSPADAPTLVSAPAVASTIVSSSSMSLRTEEAGNSTPTLISIPPASPPTPSYAPRLPITTKRLPSACAGPRCMNLLAVELGYGWKMCEGCRVQARRYQHVRKYGVGGGERGGEADAGVGMGGEVLGKDEEREERMRGEGSGVERKSVRFADDNEVFVIEPRAERDDEAAAPEAPRRRISNSSSNGQFTPHLRPLRPARRFQTVEKLLERLDEQLKAFLRARNLWVEWRMWMKGGRWGDSSVDVEEQTESTLDSSDRETRGLGEGGKRTNGEMHTRQCYPAAQAMDVDSLKAPRVFEDMGMVSEVRHLGEPLRIPAPLNGTPPHSLDIPENSSLSCPIPFSPLPGQLLAPTEPEHSPATVMTGTQSPALECLNLSHAYTLASAFTFDGAFSVVAPFCNANVKHGLKIAGVCARIWSVKEMVESVIGVKFDSGTTGGNGEEMENQGSSLAVCPCGCGQSAVTMKFCWQSTNDDPPEPTHVPSAGPTDSPTDISYPKPNENWTPSTTHPSPNNDAIPTPPFDLNPRPLCYDTTQRDPPLKEKRDQCPLGPCPPKRTLCVNTRVLRVALSITILDDPSHPHLPGQQVLVNVDTIC